MDDGSAQAASLEPPVRPTATWSAFWAAIDRWKPGTLPDHVTAAALGKGETARQVSQSLRALGLIDEDKAPTWPLRRLVKGDVGVLLDSLTTRWPALVSSMHRGDSAEAVANLFQAIPAPSVEASRRFRTFVTSALATAGVDTGAYRRLGRAAAPPRAAPRSSKGARGTRTPAGAAATAAAQLRGELAAYDAALRRAIDREDWASAAECSDRLALLRAELRAEHPT